MKQRKNHAGALLSLFTLFLSALPMLGQAGEEILRTTDALGGYQNGYLAAQEHKAFAQSPEGPWAWRGNRTTAQFAKDDALRACNSSLKKNERPCLIVNVDGNWVGKAGK